jgi:hypothetical protein
VTQDTDGKASTLTTTLLPAWMKRTASSPANNSIAGQDHGRARRTHRASLARMARLLAWACVAAIAVLSLVPGDERPHSGMSGQVEHFIAYCGTGVFLAWAYPGAHQRLVAWLVLGAASGVFEILQNFVPGRSPSLFDAVASASGLTLGMALGAAMTVALTRTSG